MMLGYMTKKEAKGLGFTNHGSYYGIPCWVENGYDFKVATKWAPMEYVMSLFFRMEQNILANFYPDREPSFGIVVGEEV